MTRTCRRPAQRPSLCAIRPTIAVLAAWKNHRTFQGRSTATRMGTGRAQHMIVVVSLGRPEAAGIDRSWLCEGKIDFSLA